MYVDQGSPIPEYGPDVSNEHNDLKRVGQHPYVSRNGFQWPGWIASKNLLILLSYAHAAFVACLLFGFI